jgi:hypothetical protein
MRYYRRRWDATRGDEFVSWGAATYYFEVGEDGWPTRQMDIYDAGPVLRYSPDRQEDEYGQLGQARLDELEDWTPWEVSQEDFDAAWKATP